MRKFIISIIFLTAIAGTAWAVAVPTEDDYQNLDRTREKLIRMRREMDKFMRDLVGPYADMDKKGMDIFGQEVRVDVTQNDKDIIVKADLPGMSKDRINITLEANKLLTISGSREVETRQESPGVIKQERSSGRFERSLELPSECESQGIKATYKEGVLEIVLPKKKGVKEEKIKVNVQ